MLAVVETVKVNIFVPPAVRTIVVEAGLRTGGVPAGPEMVEVTVTVPEKPLRLARLTVDDAMEPCGMELGEMGVAVMEKSGRDPYRPFTVV